MAGKGSDIIKIGFDYRASLNKFKQETDNTFDDIQKEGKRIVIKLNANDTEILNKIEKLQKTKFKNLSLEFDGKPLDRQIQLLDDLQKMVLNIVNLFNKGYKTDDIIDASKTLSEIDKLTKKFDDINQKYDELSKKVTSDSGKDISLVNNKDFKKLSTEIDNVKMDIKNLQDTISQLNQDVVSNSNFSDKLQDGLSSISNEVVELTSNLKKLQDTYNNLSTNSNAGKKKESNPKASTKNKQTVEKTDPQKLAAQRKAYNELTDAIKNYSNISKRIANENPFEGDYEEAVRLENKIEELQNHPLLSQKQIETAQRSIERLGVSIDNITNKLNASKSDAISNTSKKINAFNVNGFSSNDFNNKYGSQINDLNTQLMHGEISIKNYNTECNKLINAFDKVVKSGSKIGDISVAFNEAEAVAHRFSESQFSGATLIEKGVMKTKNGISSMTDTIRLQNGEIRKLKYTYTDGFLAMSDVTTKFKVQASGLSRAFGELKSKVGDLIVYWTANSLNPENIIAPFKAGVKAVRELDSALTEMRKVSNESLQSLKNYQEVTFDIADDVGTTAKTIQESTADWMRLGESITDASKSAKASNILLNVSEFDNIDDATDSLVSMSQAYAELDKIDIVDKMNNIGNRYSISTDGLATALKTSASALKTAGNDLDEAIALTTAGNAIAQDPASVGSGLRTISLRLTGTKEAKEELKSMGEDVDDVIATTSKLRDTIMSATKAASSDDKGFDILDSNGNYKSTYEILQGLADLYDNIVAKDKQLGTNNLNLILETIAGKNRANIAASILQNADMLKSVYEDVQDSEGSAAKELDAYLDSIDGKIAQLQNRTQELAFTAIDSEDIKIVIDGLSTIVELITKIVDIAGTIPTLTTLGAGILSGATGVG